MVKLESRVIAFGDEMSPNEDEHLPYFGREKGANIPLSLRFFSKDKQAGIRALSAIETKKAFKLRSAELRAQKIVKHITEANDGELHEYQDKATKHGVEFHDVGSAVGKQYLGDPDFITKFFTTLYNTVRIAHTFKIPFIRCFTLYPATQAELEEAKPAQIREFRKRYEQKAHHYFEIMLQTFAAEGLYPVIENEGNLYGNNGKNLVKFISQHDTNRILAYHDAANCVQQDHKRQGLSLQTFEQMLPFLLGLHNKDAKYSKLIRAGAVKEEEEWPYVPVGQGAGQYSGEKGIFSRWAAELPEIDRSLAGRLPIGYRKIPKPMVLEPHLTAGGQFGGSTLLLFSQAIDALVKNLDAVDIKYQQLGDYKNIEQFMLK